MKASQSVACGTITTHTGCADQSKGGGVHERLTTPLLGLEPRNARHLPCEETEKHIESVNGSDWLQVDPPIDVMCMIVTKLRNPQRNRFDALMLVLATVAVQFSQVLLLIAII